MFASLGPAKRGQIANESCRSASRIREYLREYSAPYASRGRSSTSLWLALARRCRWNSDFDLWVDSDLPREDILAIEEQLEESIVPFRVDVLLSAPNLIRLPIHDMAFKEGVLL